jgi:hypothetical protein
LFTIVNDLRGEVKKVALEMILPIPMILISQNWPPNEAMAPLTALMPLK